MTLAAALLLIAAAGCSDDDGGTGRKPSGPVAGPGAGPGPGSGGGGGGGGGQGGGGAGGAGASGGGTLIPNTACASPASAGVEVYDASAPNLQMLASVGTRWLANGEDGYVFFDRDGQNADVTPTVVLPSRSAIASEGTTGGVAASNENVIQFVRLDEDGENVEGPAGVALLEPAVLSLASNDGAALITWAFNTRLEARAIDDTGTVDGDAFDVALGAYSTYVFLQSVARGTEFGIVWSGDPAAGDNHSYFLRADKSAAIGDPVLLVSTEDVHSVAQIAATDDGYVVLFTGVPPMYRPLVMTLDATGSSLSGLMELEGAQYAYGVASTGDGFAVLVGRESGEPQLRAFDLDVTPLGDWVCLDGEHDDTIPGAISTDGDGYAAIHTTSAGALVLSRVDAAGTGAP